jgi:Ser/Thr protein kinase RdoA (MazF antagonist)
VNDGPKPLEPPGPLEPQTTPNVRVDPAALVPLIEQEYGLPGPLTCSWIRRGFNDSYLVETRSAKYVLRLYFNHKYWISGPDDFRFELELLRFVHDHGVAVAPPIPRRDGDLLGTHATDSGARHYALFAFADGAIRGPLTAAQARTLGRTLAEFHAAADRFRPSRPAYGRYHMDLRYLLDQPIELLDAFLREHGREGLERFQPHVAALRERVLALPKDRGRFGVIHGDPHRGNAAVTEAGEVTLIDFDHGGFGWRAYDLAVCWRSLPAAAQGACLEGYAAVRPLSDEERELLPTFRTLNAIWDLGDVLAMRPAWGEDEQFGAEFAARAEERLRRLFGA